MIGFERAQKAEPNLVFMENARFLGTEHPKVLISELETLEMGDQHQMCGVAHSPKAYQGTYVLSLWFSGVLCAVSRPRNLEEWELLTSGISVGAMHVRNFRQLRVDASGLPLLTNKMQGRHACQPQRGCLQKHSRSHAHTHAHMRCQIYAELHICLEPSLGFPRGEPVCQCVEPAGLSQVLELQQRCIKKRKAFGAT